MCYISVRAYVRCHFVHVSASTTAIPRIKTTSVNTVTRCPGDVPVDDHGQLEQGELDQVEDLVPTDNARKQKEPLLLLRLALLRELVPVLMLFRAEAAPLLADRFWTGLPGAVGAHRGPQRCWPARRRCVSGDSPCGRA